MEVTLALWKVPNGLERTHLNLSVALSVVGRPSECLTGLNGWVSLLLSGISSLESVPKCLKPIAFMQGDVPAVLWGVGMWWRLVGKAIGSGPLLHLDGGKMRC